ncbi:MAG: winged helix-turn-helix domain-containing protein [Actinobacteria bacterium]|jgi:DNA-binding response OmpR family regulator|nr:winged helix-turn-helix domain-containing protein [Actinomycetota bacterium]
MGHLWSTSYSGDPWVCTVHVYNRRRKIEVDPVYPQRVVSVGELGYRFAEA